MTEYKKYPEYKDSGVEWLGKIPTDWNSAKLNHIAEFNSGSTPDTNNLSYWAGHAGTPWVSIGDMSGGKNLVKHTKKSLTAEGIDSKGLKVLPVGTILFAMYASVGEVAKLNIPATCNQALLGISPKPSYDSQFLFYALKAIKTWLPKIYRSSTQNNLNAEQVKNLRIPFPPLHAQNQIVAFLDAETKKIDDSVASMESLISLLTEKRSALISETVTRGIPGEYTEFKDSGVEWLGKVSKSYRVVPTGRILSVKKELVGSLYKKFQLLSLTKNGVINRDIDSGVGKFPESFDTYQVVYPEDIVFCLFDTEETPRTVGLVQNKGMITGAYTRFEINKDLALPKFLEYYFVSIDDKKGFKPLYTGLRKTIQKPRFLSSKLVLPSILEQEKIIEFLNVETRKIDVIVKEAKKSILLLKEKRQTLISDAVTGKIDVRDTGN